MSGSLDASRNVDVIIVGAGISGIGAACHLQMNSPDRSYTILEGRDDIGGTWDLFRYPGIRSDSDMHTLGYRFKPWVAEKAIADGPSIMEYLRETVDEYGVAPHIRFRQLVQRAEWSTPDAQWVLTVDSDGEQVEYRCNYLFMCSGYYSYREAHDAQIPGLDSFEGQVVHPQWWPEDLDYADKKVVVIGSGATAVTLVPAMADHTEHITMLQRSPTYMVSRPAVDPIANGLRKVLPDSMAYELTRRKNTGLQQFMYKRMREKPEQAKDKLLGLLGDQLPADQIDAHFTPTYNPWDQRLCLVPDSDMFDAINAGRATVVTDTIDTVDATGIALSSGDHLDADIIVTATGLKCVMLGEVDIVVDGAPVDFSNTFSYKGFAYSDVPNLASSFGYINASWTLRADLICEYVCRLLNHMRDTGTVQCTPRLRPSDADMEPRPWIENFTSGYIQRVLPEMPKQGDREPWINPQNYKRDRKMFRTAPIVDGVMRFRRLDEQVAAPEAAAAELV
ncbi:MAG: NAD(P)/FAD-dependent oxidoreductase [Actinomycetota bacterium]